MINRAESLKDLYNIFLELDKCSELIGEERLTELVQARFDEENDRLYITENGSEEEVGFEGFRLNLDDMLDGLNELIGSLELNRIYDKVKSGEMTEKAFVMRAGRIKMAEIKLDELSEKF